MFKSVNRKQKRRPESGREQPRESRRDDRREPRPAPAAPDDSRPDEAPLPDAVESDMETGDDVTIPEPLPASTHGLLEELVGREIATRLRARYSEIMARIHEQSGDAAARAAFVKRAEPLNPEMWLTPDAILDGVRSADALFEQLRAELLHSSRE